VTGVRGMGRVGAWPSAALALVAVLGACSTANTGGQPITPKDLLLDRPPAGFKVAVDADLPISTAVSALSTDPGATRTQLSAFGYGGGAERVWTKGDEYVSDLVFALNSPVGPGSLISFVRSQLKPRAAVTLFDVGDEPGAQGFDLYGVSRVGNRQVFCQGVMLPLDRYMFQVTDCAGGPRYSAGPLGLGRTQYERAARLLSQPLASPSPVGG
jgi:hypothetical protein